MAQLENEDNLASARTDHPPPRHRVDRDRAARRRRRRACPSTPSSTTASAGRACATSPARPAPNSSSRCQATPPTAIQAQQDRSRPPLPRRLTVAVPRPRQQRRRRPALPLPACCHAGSKSWQTRSACTTNEAAAVRVTSHQFRHTLGTRLINAGVPQHVVQRVLGHASPEMTGIYAQLHDDTIRQAFERYQSTRVDIDRPGRRLRPRRPHRHRRMDQTPPQQDPSRPPQRLLRPATPTGLPPPQRLPHLPRLPDHRRVPRHPPPPRQLHHRAHRRRRSQRQPAPRRQPPPRPRQPHPHHRHPRNRRHRQPSPRR